MKKAPLWMGRRRQDCSNVLTSNNPVAIIMEFIQVLGDTEILFNDKNFNVKPKLIFLSTPLGIYYFLPRVFSSLTAIIL